MTTTIAVALMGAEGRMVGLPVGYMGFLAAVIALAVAAGVLALRFVAARRLLAEVRSLPHLTLEGRRGYRLDTAVPFAAQIGLWNPKLVLSQGLIDALSPQHLNAVLVHEQAHAVHRDTFWFFWLGWLRQLTSWLPGTDALWQELLLLRELRADRWAVQHVDALLLAEALLTVVRYQADAQPLLSRSASYAAFDADLPIERLEERIDALIDSESTAQSPRFPLWVIGAALTPILTIFLHY
ncbi:MAG: M56 family metallopeptidase [Cyanobacteria bacterium P01_A01_bin.135]